MDKAKRHHRIGRPDDGANGPVRVESQRTAAAAQAYAEAMLLRRGMWTHRPILANQEGFDLVCTSRERPGHLVRVQVKGRWATDSGTPNIRTDRLDGFDYLLFVRLNAGYYYHKAGRPSGVQQPEVFAFPNAVVRRYFRNESRPGRGYGGRFHYTHVPDLETYRGEAGLNRLGADLRVPDLETQTRQLVARRRSRSASVPLGASR